MTRSDIFQFLLQVFGLTFALLSIPFFLGALENFGIWGGRSASHLRKKQGIHYPRPSLGIRATEGLIFLVVGFLVLAYVALPSNRGGLTALKDMQPGFATVCVAVAGVVFLALAGAGALVLLKGRTTWAVAILALSFTSYYSSTEPHSRLIEALAPDGSGDTIVNFIIEMKDGTEGVDVWVNDVHLGQTPMTIRWRDFENKVPQWKTPPEGYNDHSKPYVWSKFRQNGPYVRRAGRSQFLKHRDDYYVRLKQGDKTGVFRSNSTHFNSGSLNDIHLIKVSIIYSLEAQFFTPDEMAELMNPKKNSARRRAEQDEKERQFRERREKLLALFNIARLRGYRIDAEWVGAVESFDADGWREILALRSREAGMGRVLDQWIAIRYGLEKVRDASTARAALKRIWEDDRSTLMRPVIERAVEMVAPQLDDPDFIAYASKAIAGKDVERSEDDKSSTAIDLGDLLKTMMILDRWMDDRDEKAGGKKQPNPVETDFVPALLRRGWDPVNAARMGGPVVEKYLLRQNWRQEVNKHGPNSEWLGMPGHVNKWLRAAAWLSGPKGREFRVREEHRILRFVRKVLSANGSPELDKHLGFLYLDADRGERSLGMKAWPEILARDWFAGGQLGTPWKYLVKMEPRPTVEMYVDAWRSALRGTNYNSYWSHFDLLNALPSEKRRQVFEGVIATARKKYMPDDKNGMGNHYLSAAERHVYLDDAQLFDELRRAQSLKDVAPDLYRDFQITAESATRNLSGVKVFGFTDADVRAASGNPRLLIPQIALHRATPENRTALEALLDDPDEEIQAAAEEVKKVLEILRARNPKDFAIKGE